MVRRSGRSRGCMTCRQRKVKCDEKLPACTQCLQHGQMCPGPIVGMVFIPMQTKAMTSKGVAAAGNDCSRRTGVVESDPLDSHTEDQKSSNQSLVDLTSRITRQRRQLASGHGLAEFRAERVDVPDPLSNFRLPPSPPSRAEPFEQMFLSHYIESFDTIRGGYSSLQPGLWFDKLPELLVSSASTPVKYSIRAVGMVFYGILTGDVPIQTEACSWYTKALNSLHCLLEHRTRLIETNTALHTGVVCAPIMMCQFETMAFTSPGAWLQHIEAAAAMLVILGPKNCSHGLAHQMLLSVRLFLVYASMTTNKPHVFASKPWLTIPFENYSKSPIDELVDILLSLPGCLAIGDKVSSEGNQGLGLIRRLRNCALDLLSQLDCWRQRFCAEVIESDGRRRTLLGPSTEERLATSDLVFNTPERRIYRDIYTATFSAIHDAASLITFSLLLLVSPLTDQHKHRIHFHAQSILSSDYFIESSGSPASAHRCLLMEFPLKTVSLWGPLQGQRDYGIRKLQSRDREGKSDSICKLATAAFLENSTVGAQSNEYYANVAAQLHLQQHYAYLPEAL